MGVKNNNTNGTSSSFKKNLTKTESFRSSSHLYEEKESYNRGDIGFYSELF